MNKDLYTAYERLKTLDLGQALGNISEACRLRAMTRPQYYEFKRRFDLYGLEGLMDQPPVHKTHPQASSPATVEQVLNISMQNPQWGCVKISDTLKRQGVSVSSPTVQKILVNHRMASRQERLYLLEIMYFQERSSIPVELLPAIESNNPCFGERSMLPSRPGQLLSYQLIPLYLAKNDFKVQLEVFVDPYCGFAFGSPVSRRGQLDAAALLKEQVIPFYAENGLKLATVTAGNANNPDIQPDLQQVLKSNKIQYIPHPNSAPHAFMDRFKEILRSEFKSECDSLENPPLWPTFAAIFREWLDFYNYTRRMEGYPNFGLPPYTALCNYLDSLNK